VGTVGALEVARNLGAQHALRRGVVRIAAHLRCDTVLDGDEHRAGIRAVMRTGAAHDAQAMSLQLVHSYTAMNNSAKSPRVRGRGLVAVEWSAIAPVTTWSSTAR